MRGPEAELVLIDELASIPKAQAVFDTALIGLRVGPYPRMLIATTPANKKIIRSVATMKGVSRTTGTTYDNAGNLSPVYLQNIRDKYEGTQLGLQELHGLLVIDSDHSLFKQEWIRIEPIPKDQIQQVSVGVDPSGGVDEHGIIVGALLVDGRYAILADRTCRGTPAHWAAEAIRAHDKFDADDLVLEVNYGGQMGEATIRRTAEEMANRGQRAQPYIRVKIVNA